MLFNLFILFVVGIINVSPVKCERYVLIHEFDILLSESEKDLNQLKSHGNWLKDDYLTALVEIQQRFANGIYEVTLVPQPRDVAKNQSPGNQSSELCDNAFKKIKAYQAQKEACFQEIKTIYQISVNTSNKLQNELNETIQNLKNFTSSCIKQKYIYSCDKDFSVFKRQAGSLLKRVDVQLAFVYQRTYKHSILTASECMITQSKATEDAQSQITAYLSSVLGWA